MTNIRLLLIFILTIFLSSCGINNFTKESKLTKAKLSQNQIHYLFILSAKQAKVSQIKNKNKDKNLYEYNLSIDLNNYHDPIIGISGHKSNNISYLSTYDLAQSWKYYKKGDSLVAKVSLSGSNINPMVFTIKNISMSDNKIEILINSSYLIKSNIIENPVLIFGKVTTLLFSM